MRRSRAPSRVALSPSPAPRVVSDGTDGEKSDGTSSSSSTSQDIKRVNTVALRLGTVNVVRAPLLGCLSVPRGPGLVAGAFKLPGGARRTDQSESLLRRKSLGVRRPVTFMTPSKFRQPGGGSPEPAPAGGDFEIEQGEGEDGDQAEPAAPVDEKPFEPLVLWEAGPGEDDHRISVDPRLCKWLRPHQREGVQFMFECVMGMRDFEGNGCILADDMGLGKTLQSITVLWTLLKQGKEKGAPMVKRAVVVCPTSLVKNWEAEIDKWLKGDCRVIALSETTRDQVVQSITLFLSSLVYRVLIVSYETFRLHSKRFYEKPDSCCDLLICDEAHRLKNSETATNQALAGLKCRRRILLSGTPMQNDLEEFYAMTDFTNPGILGSGSSFRKNFLAPILAGREPSATEKQVERAQKCQNEMSTVVNEFILRRTNNINAKHLPPKLVQVVCCRLTPVQRKIYKHLLSSKEIRHILNGKQTNILSSIGAMQKLCNHPKLLVEGSSAGRGQDSGLAEVASFLPSSNPATALARPGGVGGAASGGLGAGTRRGGGIVQKGVFPEWSGKMETLFRLMREMRRTGDDRIVVVSNYTQSLDLIGAMCRENSWPFVRLDGSTGVSKRQKMVNAFNEPGLHAFAFLLSSKAGGCGLNLIGGNRLVLFDPDWNPAIDKQAAARVWRDGQKKRCFVYRFLTTGTIEEKVFQRQLSKEGLQNIVDDKEEVNSLSSKDLKDLFTLLEGTPSDTHDKLRCKRCRIEEAVQAIKEADALAFQRALPNQLKLCEQLLEELWALPMGDLFHQQWDPETEGIPPDTFLSLVHEPMDFGRIAAKLRAVEADGQGAEHGGASPTCSSEGHQPSGEGGAGPGEHFSEGDGREDRSAGNHVGDGLHVVQVSEDARPCHPAGRAQVDAAMAMPYTSVPAFARDMNLVFANIRRVWPMGNPGSDNRLTKAADSLKLTFDTRWRALAPHLHSIQREALEEAREEAKVKGIERAKACEGEGAVPPPRFQEQMGMPKEEDLNSWSHHYSTDTADDPVFRGAMMGTGDSLVSFVFGLEVTWGLMQTQIEAEAEARALEIKAKAEARAARAAAKAEAAAAAAAAAAAEAEAEAETEAVAEAEVAEVTGAGSIVTTPQSQSSQSGTSPSREGRQRRRNGRKRKRVASIIDEDEDEDEDQGDGEDEDDDDEAQEEDEASSGSEMDFSSQDAGSGDEMAASSSPDAPREAGNPRRMKRVKTGSRERVVLPTGSPLAPRESPAGESDRRAQCGREGVKPQEAAAKENCWMHQDGELGTEAGILQQNGDLNSHREEGPEAKQDKTEGVGAGEDREEEEQDVDVEAVSEGGGTQVDDHPEVESSPAGEEGVVRSQSEDEVLETPLSGSDQESALGSMGNAVERSVHGNTAEAGGVRGGNARALGEWLCPKCTFANAASRRKCLMCMEGSRPPGMGRTQPLSPRPLHEGNMESGRHEGPRQRKEKTRRGDESSSKDGTGKESTSSRKMREKKRKREIWIDDDEDYKEC